MSVKKKHYIIYFMKKILCYGDSNTYGFTPETCGRYKKNERWSGILSTLLGTDFEVIEEGMNNRTGFFKNSNGLMQSGSEYLPIVLGKYEKFDICILSLGTNDLQFFFDLDENMVEIGLTKLVQILRNSNQNMQIIIIPPVKIKANIINGMFVSQFDLNSVKRGEKVFHKYLEFAKKENCFYLDLNEFVTPSEIDGLHYDVKSHRIIAEKIANLIKTI